jgi:hypothetical protein
LQPIRTASEINVHIRILPVQSFPLYQKIAQKATKLHLLGMTYGEIAKNLKVGKTTVSNALTLFRKRLNNAKSCHSERSEESKH